MTGDHAADLARALERIAAPHISAQGHIWARDCDACHRQEIARTALALYRESAGREDGPSAGAGGLPRIVNLYEDGRCIGQHWLTTWPAVGSHFGVGDGNRGPLWEALKLAPNGIHVRTLGRGAPSNHPGEGRAPAPAHHRHTRRAKSWAEVLEPDRYEYCSICKCVPKDLIAQTPATQSAPAPAEFEGHTAGPWRVTGDDVLMGPNGEIIADIAAMCHPIDARLIAHAPTLLSENTRLAAKVAEIEGALEQCRKWFAEYALAHTDKNTAEGDAKAARNMERVNYCADVLQGRAARALGGTDG